VFPLLPLSGSRKEPEDPPLPRSPVITVTATPPKTLRLSSSEGLLCPLPTQSTPILLSSTQTHTPSVTVLPPPIPLLSAPSSTASTPSKVPKPTPSTPVAATQAAPVPLPSPVAVLVPASAAAVGFKSAMLSFEHGLGQIGDDPFSELS
jgi:hypothetical protein